MPTERDIVQLLREIGTRLDCQVSLDVLAARAGWSRFHFHRAFRRIVGETPKRYTNRLRLEGAAARLVTTDEPIVSIAARAGFASHAVFTRAFRRQFGRTPAAYRARASGDVRRPVWLRHAALTAAAGPCVGLFHLPLNYARRIAMPTLSIERRELAAQPILFVRARAARHEISTAIGQCLGKAYPYALSSGQAIAGRPFTRYLTAGPGLFTMEIGVPISAAAPGEGDVETGSLPGGPAVVGVHAGPYDQLGETYAAIQSTRSCSSRALTARSSQTLKVAAATCPHTRPGTCDTMHAILPRGVSRNAKRLRLSRVRLGVRGRGNGRAKHAT